jgi:hypothetical protein
MTPQRVAELIVFSIFFQRIAFASLNGRNARGRTVEV